MGDVIARSFLKTTAIFENFLMWQVTLKCGFGAPLYGRENYLYLYRLYLK
jgi:hypothetical protein